MKISTKLKEYLHWAGSTLALAGIIFLILRLRKYAGQIDFGQFDITVWFTVGGSTVIYSFTNLMLALAWWNLLRSFGAYKSKRWALNIYGTSQLAKYVPGNIFHIAGRQAMGMAAGVPGWSLVKSSAWELGLISIAGTMFVWLTLPLIVPAIPVVAALGLFAMSIAGFTVLLSYYFSLFMTRALVWYIGFLAISGALFVGLVGVVSEYEAGDLSWIPLGGAYVIAWLAGLVTPGAPAGLGVRELVLLFLLKGIVEEADLVLAVVLGRVVTVGGDLATFFVATLVSASGESRGE